MTTPAMTDPQKTTSVNGALPGAGTIRCTVCDRTRPPDPTPVVGGTPCSKCGILR